MKPSIGRIVLFYSDDLIGVVECPAIITRVWSDTCVNLTVFPNCGIPYTRTSVTLNENVVVDTPGSSWRWPPRV